MKFYSFLILISIFNSCTEGIETKPVDLVPFFCDNSSKVWMVNNINLRNPEMEVPRVDFKEVFIFYKYGKVLIQPLNSLGNKSYEKASYSINSDTRIMEIDFEESKEKWIFFIDKVSIDKVILKPIFVNSITKKIELIPLPEL